MIDFDDKEIRDLKKSLGKFRMSLPIAEQRTMNRAAKATAINAKRRAKKNMIMKNKWTEGSIQWENQKGLFKSATPAKVGSLQDYMADQEFGKVKRKKSKEGLRITTSFAAGQGRGSRRTRLARGINKIRKIRLQNKRVKGKNSKQRTLLAVKDAAKHGRKFVYLEMRHRRRAKGIYRLKGGKRRPKVDMVHSLSQTSVRIKRNPWLEPSVDAIVPVIPRFWMLELKAQAKRHLK